MAEETAESAVTNEDLVDAEQLGQAELERLRDSETSEEGDEPGPTDEDVQAQIDRDSDEDKSRVSATDTSKPASKDAAAKPSSAVPTYVPRDNPLHDYATYTYSIALFILSKTDIATLTTDPSKWSPNQNSVKTCLVASGGKNVGYYERNPNFTDDFYFDNLKMTTVIGMNARSKASNAIDISFTLLEPYGMSLLDRIIEAANDIEAPNFKAMPYLLEVEFYGYDDTGKATKIDGQRKRMPIQIIEVKIKVGTKGTEYAIKAVPWNHQALSASAATTPINVEVAAATVEDFFANNESDMVSVTQQDAAKVQATSERQRLESDSQAAKEPKLDKSGRQTAESDPRVPKPTPSADARPVRTAEQQTAINTHNSTINKAFSVKSFGGGVNGWFNDLVIKKLRGTRDQIFFEIHGSKEVPKEKIANAKIVVPASKDISRSATTSDKPEEAAKAAAKNSNRVFTDASSFPISAGTSIPQVIDMIMRNSSYITDQISDPKNTSPSDLAEKQGKPLYWYKIIPTVEIGDYDYAIGKFSTKTTYHIMPYIVYDSKHPNGPVAAPQGAMKKYSYTYTGKNVDILDFQIDFDTLFYTAVTAGSAKWQAELITKAEQQKDEASRVAAEGKPSARELVNRQLRLVNSQPQQQGAGGQQGSAQQVLAGDVQKSQYSSSRGDMLNLRLKIVGDPELIKQDDIYTNPSQGGYNTQVNTLGIMPDSGSVPMDNGEVIAQVDFRTIVDMDDSTGLPRKEVAADKGVFSGQYRILTVDNLFQGGQFVQTVDMVRVPDVANEAKKDAGKGQDNPKSETFASKDEIDAESEKLKRLAGARQAESGTNAEGDDFDPYKVENDDTDEGPNMSGFESDNEGSEDSITDDTGADPDYNELSSIDEGGDTVSIEDSDFLITEPPANNG